MRSSSQYLGRLVLLGVLLVVSRALDLLGTYLSTPELSNELNPVVRFSGSGWEGLLAVQLPFALLALAMAAYYEIGPSRFLPPRQPLSLNEFESHLYRDQRRSLVKLLFSRVEDLKLIWFSLGYILPRAMCLNGLILGLWAITVWQWNHTHGGVLLAASPIVFIAAYLVPIWLFQRAFVHEQYRMFAQQSR